LVDVLLLPLPMLVLLLLSVVVFFGVVVVGIVVGIVDCVYVVASVADVIRYAVAVDARLRCDCRCWLLVCCCCCGLW